MIILASEENLGTKYFGSKTFLVQKLCKKFCPRKSLVQNIQVWIIYFGPIIFGPKVFGSKKIWIWRKFWTKKVFDLKTFWVRKIWVPKDFIWKLMSSNEYSWVWRHKDMRFLSTNECSWALLSSHKPSWALMGPHELGAVVPYTAYMHSWALKIAHDAREPYFWVLLSANKCSWVLMSGHVRISAH